MLKSFFRRRQRRAAVLAAYSEIVARARDPEFFVTLGVPDTLDGRFELLVLHAFLVLHRLKSGSDSAAAFAQDLFDVMFADLDRGLREMGATDIGVGRHVKAMVDAFYGRVAAYEAGLDNSGALEAALRRNLYGTVVPQDRQIAAVASYVRRQIAALHARPFSALLAGDIGFAVAEGAS